jgi:hypothetical protein
MNALLFGLPVKDGLVCANPICTAYADYIIHTGAPEKPLEVLACAEHMHGLSAGKRILKLEKLKEPGSRNK